VLVAMVRQLALSVSVTDRCKSPPTTPTSSPSMSSSAYQEQARRFYSYDRPPVSLKSGSHLPPGRRSDPSTSSRAAVSRGQDNRGVPDSRRLQNPGSSPLLSTWNGGGSSTSVASSDTVLLSLPPSSAARAPSTGGAVSMPSSPRLGRRTHGNQEPLPTSRTRKYSAGSLSSLTTGSHSRSLPRLCPSSSHRGDSSGTLPLSMLPLRQADINGSYKSNKESYSNNPNANPEFSNGSSNSYQQVSNRNYIQTNTQGEGVVSISLSAPKNTSSPTYSISSTTAPPDVTIPSKAGGSSSPRVAKKLSLTSTSSLGSVSSTNSSPPEAESNFTRGVSAGIERSLGEKERGAGGLELTCAPVLGLGEMRASFGKAGVDHGTGLGERRQSFGKAGVTPLGGFRERRGSISSLSGKEELTDYHQRQKEERVREQEVERLVKLGRAERDGGGPAASSTSAVVDLQKINQELERLQVNDDDDDTPSVFSDSSAVNGVPGSGHTTSLGSENCYFDDDLQVRQRRSSGHRDYWAESPAVSLRSFVPSPFLRTLRTNEVSVTYSYQAFCYWGYFGIHIRF
ncbi:hypothetical protein XENOCAPTIV_025137, partial [Xenoophorus captivus]